MPFNNIKNEFHILFLKYVEFIFDFEYLFESARIKCITQLLKSRTILLCEIKQNMLTDRFVNSCLRENQTPKNQNI